MVTQTVNMISEADATTGENVIRPMTAEELLQYKTDKAQRDEAAQILLNQQKAKEAVIAKLGLTTEEVSVLLSA